MLTLIERGGEPADEITDLTHPATNGAHVVGITGAPGAGKSTLTGQLIRHLPTLGLKPAVLASEEPFALLVVAMALFNLMLGGAFWLFGALTADSVPSERSSSDAGGAGGEFGS